MGKLTLCVGRSVSDGQGSSRGRAAQLTEFTDSGLEHLILSGQHLRLGLVESALITIRAEQPIFTLKVVWGGNGTKSGRSATASGTAGNRDGLR